jgi:hypothetical protein
MYTRCSLGLGVLRFGMMVFTRGPFTVDFHSDNEKGVGGMHGQSCDARSEEMLWWRHDRVKEIGREYEERNPEGCS